MGRTVRAAVIQTRTGTDPAANLSALADQVRAAAADGATLIATPEGSNLLQRDKARFAEVAPLVDDREVLAGYGALAQETGATLLIGSAVMRRAEGKAANRSLLFGPDGALIASYDKIHLFDVFIGLGNESRESLNYAPGDRAVAADTPAGRIGMTICYDLRFAHLYRQLARAGAEIMAIPAAFTVPTGRAHWEILMRARAIETGSYVLAPAQGGLHEDGRSTWGRSLIIDPWGVIVASLDNDEPGMAVADLDLDLVQETRAKMPAWGFDAEYAAP
jgi:deaminated glutathione amidase